MITLHYCIQCRDNLSGIKGTFAYDKEAYDLGDGFNATSPLFSCVSEFYAWAKAKGFKSPSHGLGFTMIKED